MNNKLTEALMKELNENKIELEESKFDLESAAQEVYAKAEEFYKGSEINSMTLMRVAEDHMDNKFTQAQLEDLQDYFEEQERLYMDLEEQKSLTEDEVTDYEEQEKALAKDYKKRVTDTVTPEIVKNFGKLKEIVEEGGDIREYDGFYFPAQAIQILENTKEQYHLNGNMDLTIADILNMVGENDTPEEALDELFKDYKPDSALSWGDNFITVLSKLNFDIEQDADDEEFEESKEIKTEDIGEEGNTVFALKMECVNEAFGGVDEDGEGNEDVMNAEVARILTEIANKVKSGRIGNNENILDANGNVVGKCGFGYAGVVDAFTE